MAEISTTEGSPLAKDTALATAFKDPIGNSVFVGSTGTNNLSVVGPGIFKDITLRHLFMEISRTHFWLRDSWGVPDQDAKFLQQFSEAFHGVPHEKYLSLLLNNPHPDDAPPGAEINADVADLPPGFVYFLSWSGADEKLICSYFAWGIPFNAPSNINDRITLVDSNHPGHGNKPSTPGGPPSYSDLRAMAPDSYSISSWIILTKLTQGGHMTKDEELALLSPYFDYNSNSLAYFRILADKQGDIDDATIEMILRKECALKPEKYFSLGELLRKQGKVDEAAEADRTGVKLSTEQVYVSDSVQSLVEYDFNHNQQDEAMQVAKAASDVYSYRGIETYIWLLCKLNRFDEAEDWERKLQERYGGNPFPIFYAAHADHYPEQYKAAEKTLFPDGMLQVTLDSFTEPPKSGIIITESSSVMKTAGLQQGDVLVALDSHPVRNLSTYEFVRALSENPIMDFIIWRNGKYLELKPSLPNRRFESKIKNYPPR